MTGATISIKNRIATLACGVVGNWIMVYGFDFLLYPYVIWKYGIVAGGIVMTVLSFLICYLTIIFYDWAKKDWLGIETVKSVREYQGASKRARVFSWLLSKGDKVVLIFLSIKFDPFITVAYMRHGANKYNGLSSRDWGIFISSLAISNIYWTLVAFTGVSLFEFVWRYFK